jgi:hypothetical protein
MRTVRNITVAVEHELYRQTRRIAAASPNPSGPSTGKSGISSCAPVNASQPYSLQQLATQQPVLIQSKYSSISTLKAIISKAL